MKKFGVMLESGIDMFRYCKTDWGSTHTNNPLTPSELIKHFALLDILNFGCINSDEATDIYYKILKEHEDILPDEMKKALGNGQESYRVIVRNVFSSNSEHIGGLATNKFLKTTVVNNESRRGNKRIYEAK